MLASIAAFHEGQAAEAKRMAVAVRLLAHDTGRSHSLLAQLGIKNGVLFYDTTGSVTEPGLVSGLGLAGMVLAMGKGGPRSFWTPNLDGGPDRRDLTVRPFHSWWTRPVIKDNRGVFFSRRVIVLGVADQDGGAHVDPDLDASYGQFTRGSSIGWRMDIGNGLEEIPGLELACVRQVAHELLVSLACQAPYAFPAPEQAAFYASHMLATKGATLEIETTGLRAPLGSLPREALDDIGASRGVGRNVACPCGSGEKYKHCHGL